MLCFVRAPHGLEALLMTWQHSSLRMHRWRQTLSQYREHSTFGKSTKKACELLRLVLIVIPYRGVLYLVLDTQDHHKRWGRLQQFTSMEVITTRRCIQQRKKRGFIMSCPVRKLLSCCPAHVTTTVDSAPNILQQRLRFFAAAVQGDGHQPNVTKRHHTSPFTRQRSWIGSALSNDSAQEGPLPGLHYLRSEPLYFFLWGFVKGEAQCSVRLSEAQFHQCSQKEKDGDCKTCRAVVAKCLALRRTSSLCVLVRKWNTY